MRVLQIGNFGPPHSTENHLKRALQNNGHQVTEIQENQPAIWKDLARGSFMDDQDFILWTRTGWDYSRLEYGSQEDALIWQMRTLREARKRGLSVISYHLDLFWGLNPERVAILDEPFFQTDLVTTADGGHQAQFEAKGIPHVWFPPGVSLGECEPGMFRDEFHSPLAFVGSWQGDYHKESEHRFELVRWLQTNFARDCVFWPQPGHHAVRGTDLRDLYASVDVVVGDSCFAGQIPNYWSDRVPETLGRGGFLLHPYVQGFDEQFCGDYPALVTWGAGDWDMLGSEISLNLGRSRERRAEMTSYTRGFILQHHTYERRMLQLVDLMVDRALLPTDIEKSTPAKKAAPKKRAASK